MERLASTGMQKFKKKSVYKKATFKIFFHYVMPNVILGFVSLMKCRMKVDERDLKLQPFIQYTGSKIINLQMFLIKKNRRNQVLPWKSYETCRETIKEVYVNILNF